MKPIIVYTTNYCGYCVAAKRLLDKLGLPYSEQDVSNDPAERQRLVERSGQRTVPQIFIGDHSVGGYQELSELARRGTLQALVEGSEDD